MRVPFAFMKGSAGFNIADLALSGWFRGDNWDATTGVWTSSASAGTSGSRSLTDNTVHKPPAGTALNGHGTVSFVRSNGNRITDAASVTTDYITTTAWSCWALLNNTSSSAAGGKTSAYSNNGVVTESGSYWVGACTSTTNSGVAQAYQWHSGGFGVEQALTDGVWSLMQSYYDGTTLYCRVNSGAWQSQACGAIDVLAGSNLYLGCNYTTAVRFNGLLAEVGLSKSAFSQTTFDDIKTALNSYYALSL